LKVGDVGYGAKDDMSVNWRFQCVGCHTKPVNAPTLETPETKVEEITQAEADMLAKFVERTPGKEEPAQTEGKEPTMIVSALDVIKQNAAYGEL